MGFSDWVDCRWGLGSRVVGAWGILRRSWRPCVIQVCKMAENFRAPVAGSRQNKLHKFKSLLHCIAPHERWVTIVGRAEAAERAFGVLSRRSPISDGCGPSRSGLDLERIMYCSSKCVKITHARYESFCQSRDRCRSCRSMNILDQSLVY